MRFGKLRSYNAAILRFAFGRPLRLTGHLGTMNSIAPDALIARLALSQML